MAQVSDRPPYSYRDDPAVPDFDDSGPIAFMDGECILCAGGARTIARLDRRREFRICPTQSPLGEAVVRHYGLEPGDPETWLYLEEGRGFSGMEAMIRIGARLGGAGRVLGFFRLYPAPAREWLYRRIARNRHVFGKTDMCRMADPELQARLIQ
jgi:predicted DCC family thiol-disulfide oxidoreductase YuxK